VAVRSPGPQRYRQLEAGKRADIALFDLNHPAYSGAQDPSLHCCCVRPLRSSPCGGRPGVVDDHKLTTLEMSPVLARHRRIAAASPAVAAPYNISYFSRTATSNSAAP